MGEGQATWVVCSQHVAYGASLRAKPSPPPPPPLLLLLTAAAADGDWSWRMRVWEESVSGRGVHITPRHRSLIGGDDSRRSRHRQCTDHTRAGGQAGRRVGAAPLSTPLQSLSFLICRSAQLESFAAGPRTRLVVDILTYLFADKHYRHILC